MMDEETIRSIEFYLWSRAGDIGTSIAYHELIDVLVDDGLTLLQAVEVVNGFWDTPWYFDRDWRSDGLYFIKESLEEP